MCSRLVVAYKKFTYYPDQEWIINDKETPTQVTAGGSQGGHPHQEAGPAVHTGKVPLLHCHLLLSHGSSYAALCCAPCLVQTVVTNIVAYR